MWRWVFCWIVGSGGACSSLSDDSGGGTSEPAFLSCQKLLVFFNRPMVLTDDGIRFDDTEDWLFESEWPLLIKR
jgi:hypothetical protein